MRRDRRHEPGPLRHVARRFRRELHRDRGEERDRRATNAGEDPQKDDESRRAAILAAEAARHDPRADERRREEERHERAPPQEKQRRHRAERVEQQMHRVPVLEVAGPELPPCESVCVHGVVTTAFDQRGVPRWLKAAASRRTPNSISRANAMSANPIAPPPRTDFPSAV